MLYLTGEQIDRLINHAREEYPNEACGILSGKGGNVKEIYRMTNADRSADSFFMEPQEQLRVMKDIRRSGQDFIGVYHSHPETDAYPSRRDVELAYYPSVSYVVISLKQKDRPVIRSFKIIEGKIEEEEIKSLC